MGTWRAASCTDVGMKRDHNEDSFLASDELGLYVVCDGMGGHAGGETASRLSVEAIERALLAARQRPDNPFAADKPLGETPLADALREAIEGASAEVYRKSHEDPELTGMGTTCTALLVHGGFALVGHVGDSRAYLVRDGVIVQLSEDHSLVNEQVRAGLLTPEEAKHSRLKNIITRSVGFEEEVLVDLVGLETKPGDKLLLCSDGLSNLVENEEIRDALVQRPISEVPQALIALANERGGDDNITVIALDRTG